VISNNCLQNTSCNLNYSQYVGGGVGSAPVGVWDQQPQQQHSVILQSPQDWINWLEYVSSELVSQYSIINQLFRNEAFIELQLLSSDLLIAADLDVIHSNIRLLQSNLSLVNSTLQQQLAQTNLAIYGNTVPNQTITTPILSNLANINYFLFQDSANTNPPVTLLQDWMSLIQSTLYGYGVYPHLLFDAVSYTLINLATAVFTNYSVNHFLPLDIQSQLAIISNSVAGQPLLTTPISPNLDLLNSNAFQAIGVLSLNLANNVTNLYSTITVSATSLNNTLQSKVGNLYAFINNANNNLNNSLMTLASVVQSNLTNLYITLSANLLGNLTNVYSLISSNYMNLQVDIGALSTTLQLASDKLNTVLLSIFGSIYTTYTITPTISNQLQNISQTLYGTNSPSSLDSNLTNIAGLLQYGSTTVLSILQNQINIISLSIWASGLPSQPIPTPIMSILVQDLPNTNPFLGMPYWKTNIYPLKPIPYFTLPQYFYTTYSNSPVGGISSYFLYPYYQLTLGLNQKGNNTTVTNEGIPFGDYDVGYWALYSSMYQLQSYTASHLPNPYLFPETSFAILITEPLNILQAFECFVRIDMPDAMAVINLYNLSQTQQSYLNIYYVVVMYPSMAQNQDIPVINSTDSGMITLGTYPSFISTRESIIFGGITSSYTGCLSTQTGYQVCSIMVNVEWIVPGVSVNLNGAITNMEGFCSSISYANPPL
jgi:hypothetical protein